MSLMSARDNWLNRVERMPARHVIDDHVEASRNCICAQPAAASVPRELLASVSVHHIRARSSGLKHSGDVDGSDCVVAVGQREADVDDAGPGECVAHPESAIAGVRGRELVPRS